MAEQGLSDRYNAFTYSQLIHNNGALTPARNLVETNLMLADAMVSEGNEVLGHTGTRQSSIPTPQIVKVGAYWSGSVAQWSKFHDDISIFRDTIVVPKDVMTLYGAGHVASVEDSHKEGFGQGVQNHLIYGDSSQDPEKFDGLDVRYTTPDDRGTAGEGPLNPASTADYGVWDAGGTGSDTTSIWFIQWGDMKTKLITPFQDPQMGIKVTDMGLQKEVTSVSEDATSHRWSYYTELEWMLGLSIHDIRGVARLRNIETSIDSIDVGIKKQIIQILTEAFRGPELVWMYVPPRMETHMKILAEAKQNVLYSKDNPYNIPLLTWDNAPIRRCDSILLTETAVAAA